MMWGLLILGLLLLMFLLVPVWYRPQTNVQQRSEENLRLYQERTAELAASDASEADKQALQLELDREFLSIADNSDETVVLTDSRKRWPWAILMLVFGLLVSAMLYQQWGAGTEMRTMGLLQKMAVGQLSSDEMTELRDGLSLASIKHPQVMEWSYIYGRFSLGLGDYRQAEKAFADILVSLPEEETADRAAIMGLLAQARYFGKQQADEATYGLLADAISLSPNDPQLLGLAGMMAYELEQFQNAIDHWKTLWLNLPDTPETRVLAEGIQRAADELAQQGQSVDLSWLKRVSLELHVDLSRSARAALSPDTVVFVLARAVDGSPMPLAAQRLTVADLPATVILSDAQAMAPGMNLSSVEQVTVIARASVSGQPVASAGDWQVQLTPVATRHDKPLKLVISEPVR